MNKYEKWCEKVAKEIRETMGYMTWDVKTKIQDDYLCWFFLCYGDCEVTFGYILEDYLSEQRDEILGQKLLNASRELKEGAFDQLRVLFDESISLENLSKKIKNKEIIIK